MKCFSIFVAILIFSVVSVQGMQRSIVDVLVTMSTISMFQLVLRVLFAHRRLL